MSQSQQLTIEQAISQAEKTARQGNVAVARQLYNAASQHQPNRPVAEIWLCYLSLDSTQTSVVSSRQTIYKVKHGLYIWLVASTVEISLY